MKQNKEEGHDPENNIRKIIYDCFDFRIVNEIDESIPTWVIINQNGWLGIITEQNEKYNGCINDCTNQFLSNNFETVVCDTFDECIIELTNAHVKIFHDAWKKIKNKEYEKVKA